MCGPSSGCLENLSYYTMRVVPFCGGGRDLALQHESWKVVTVETNILRGYINCTYLKNLLCFMTVCMYRNIHTLQPYIIDFTQRGCHTLRFDYWCLLHVSNIMCSPSGRTFVPALLYGMFFVLKLE